MKKFKVVVSLAVIITLLFSGSLGVSGADYGSYFESMIEFVKGMYYKGLTDEDGLKNALRGLFSGLDQYSGFYDKAETEALYNSLSGNYVGIGAVLEVSGAYIKITRVYEGSPAEKAGVRDGDLIMAVDGVSVENKEARTVASEILGDAGTTVTLTIKRGSDILQFSIVRGKVVVSPVGYRIEGNMAYISIDSFSTGSGSKFGEAMDQINKNEIKKIILDLRGNPGGYVDEAVSVAKRLIPPGVITTLDFKTEEIADRVYTSHAKNRNYIVAVLVDENSASASEILAGALEDSGIGVLIGQKTFGKGVFQNMFSILTPEAFEKYSIKHNAQLVTDVQWMSYYSEFPEKDEILGTVKLTTGHYLTPNGRELSGVGLEPTITLPNRTNPNGVDLSRLEALANTAPIALNSYSRDVYFAESVLKAAGYMTAAADKQFDGASQEALKKYQATYKLPSTGIIDLKTRDQLNKTLTELRSKNDLQYTKAVEVLNWFSN